VLDRRTVDGARAAADCGVPANRAPTTNRTVAIGRTAPSVRRVIRYRSSPLASSTAREWIGSRLRRSHDRGAGIDGHDDSILVDVDGFVTRRHHDRGLFLRLAPERLIEAEHAGCHDRAGCSMAPSCCSNGFERGLRLRHLVPLVVGHGHVAKLSAKAGDHAAPVRQPPSTMRSCPRAKRFTARPQHCARPW